MAMYRDLIPAIGLVSAVVLQGSAGAESLLPLANPGFEEGLRGWTAVDNGMSRVVPEAAHGGGLGLRVTDTDGRRGSDLRARALPVTPGRAYALRFWARPVASSGVAVYFQFRDAGGNILNRPEKHNEIILIVPGGKSEWRQYTLFGRAPEQAVELSLWIHSINASKAAADLDDFALSLLTEEEARVVKTSVPPSRRFPVPEAERIAEIAEMLAPIPAGLGRPIFHRKAWDALAAAQGADRVIRDAESCLNTPPPELPDELYLEFSRNGNRTRYQRPYGRRVSRLSALLKAECLENKGRFLAAIERDALAVCAERSWVMPAHDSGLDNFNNRNLYVDLGCSLRGWLLATTDWWLQDKLAPATRRTIRAEVKRRVFEPYLKALRSGDLGRGFWWMRGTNNWNPVCNAGVVGAALTLVEAPIERAEFLAGMELSNPYFLSGFTADGYCSEGMGYWNYGFGHYMMLGEIVLEATSGKLDIYQDGKLPNIAAYPRGFQIQKGLSPAFADCSVGARPSPEVLALIQRRFPDSLLEEVGPLSPVRRGFASLGLLGFGEGLHPGTARPPRKGVLPVRTWFENAGILISRAGPGEDKPFGAAIKGGHNAEHHNHNDVGSYLVVRDGHAYLLDPGGEVYTRRTFSRQRYVSKVLNSYGHPVPLVGGNLQSSGRRAEGKVLESEFTSETDRLVLDLRSAYDVPELERLVRTFVHDRRSRTITIQDEVAFSKPTAFGTALVTFDRVFRRASDTLVVYDGSGSVVVDIAVSGGEWTLESETIENPDRPEPTRLGINLNEPVTTASVRLTIVPAELAADLPGTYHAPKEGPGFRPKTALAITIQAEDFSAQRGGQVTRCEKPGASQGAFKYWDDNGHALDWTFETPTAGRFAIRLRSCHASSTPVTRKVLIDGKPVGDPSVTYLFPTTGGWSSKTDDWRDIWLADKGEAVVVELGAGTHTLTMVNDCGIGLNLDWIQFVPLAD